MVAVDKPCYLCGLSFVEAADDKTVAIVPGWFLFDLPRPRFSESQLSRFAGVAAKLILDFSQVGFLNSAGIRVLVALNTAAQEVGLEFVLANVRPDVTELFRVSRLSRVFKIVKDVDDGLDDS